MKLVQGWMIICLLSVLIIPSYAELAQFSSEKVAQKHCPHDEVVWLNTHTGIWHTQGERWYGRTKHGTYVCKAEAAKAGDRENLNGQ